MFACTLSALPILSACFNFTDGATRLAQQIEAETANFVKSGAVTHTIIHAPEQINNNGCARDEAYTLQVDKVGALILWCKHPATGEVTRSHSTSYHARFVDSPETWIINKQPGESTSIELRRGAAKPVIANVR